MSPAPLVSVDLAKVEKLEEKLTADTTSLSEKYRILFSLRNIAGHRAHSAMLLGLKDTSALYRHEVAYCLGQRQDPAAIEALKRILGDTSEHGMVRSRPDRPRTCGCRRCYSLLPSTPVTDRLAGSTRSWGSTRCYWNARVHRTTSTT
jgi:hypothetical protein